MLSKRLLLRSAAAAVGLAALPAFGQYSGATPVPDKYKTGFDSITIEKAQDILGYLAGPECEGRGTGQPGYQKAAEYVAARFKELGLKAIDAEGDYLQQIPFRQSTADPDKSMLVGPNGIAFELGDDFGLSGVSKDVTIQGEVMFLRVEGQNTDVSKLEAVDGKIVVVGGSGAGRAAFRLRRAGAIAVVSVVDKASSPASTSLASGRVRTSSLPPRASVSKAAARRLALGMGVSANWNTENIGETGLKLHEAFGKLTIEAGHKSAIINVPNVVGMLEGSDPDLKHEHIGIGSHLDHMGKSGDTIYYGADDDGSGSTAVLLTAEALVKSDVKPKRSIVFMCFAAEEIGLVGSRYYTENPLLPLEDMVCLLQMDMVGRNEESADEPASENVQTIHLVGSKRISMDLHGLTISSNRHLGFTFEYDQESVYSRSDHANFARKGVPITFLFSGFHPDYHRPTDTIDKINFDKLTNSAKLNYLVAIQAANRPERLKKDAAGR